VRHLARELDLALEALEALFVVADLLANRLERDALVQVEVLHLVDLAHPAAREQAHDPEAAGQELSRREGGHSWGGQKWPKA
jgi:hypothetical protein